MSDVTYEPIHPPSEIESRIQRLVQRYSLRYAAIDFAVDLLGRWYFFEVNPNGQWAWLEIAGDIKISDSFIRSFDNNPRRR
jgi:D-alanine-D-alanine ligase-like ATP-grasp enzyme